eukprot:gene8977-biopygen19683
MLSLFRTWRRGGGWPLHGRCPRLPWEQANYSVNPGETAEDASGTRRGRAETRPLPFLPQVEAQPAGRHWDLRAAGGRERGGARRVRAISCSYKRRVAMIRRCMPHQ